MAHEACSIGAGDELQEGFQSSEEETSRRSRKDNWPEKKGYKTFMCDEAAQ